MKKLFLILSLAMLMSSTGLFATQTPQDDGKKFFGIFNTEAVAPAAANKAFDNGTVITDEAASKDESLAIIKKVAAQKGVTVKMAAKADEANLKDEPAVAAQGGIVVNGSKLAALAVVSGVNLENAMIELIAHEKAHNDMKAIQGNLPANEKAELNDSKTAAMAEEKVTSVIGVASVVAEDVNKMTSEVYVEVANKADGANLQNLVKFGDKVQYVTAAELDQLSKSGKLANATVISPNKTIKGSVTVNIPAALTSGSGSLAYVAAILETIRLINEGKDASQFAILLGIKNLPSKLTQGTVIAVTISPAQAFADTFIADVRKAFQVSKGL